jgi:hypothetical protein
VTPEADNEIALVRLEGKIDALSAKLDGRLDAVMAKIEAGDRESLQLFELQKSEVGHVAGQVRANTERVAAVALESQARDAEITAQLLQVKASFDTQIADIHQDISDLPTVRKLVYGFVGLVLVAVVGALLALVVVGT